MYLSHYIGVLNILIHIPDTLNKVIVFHRVGTLVYYVNTVCVPWCFTVFFRYPGGLDTLRGLSSQ